MRDVYIAVESLRNSADLVSSRLASFIHQSLVFVDGRGPDWVDRRRVLLESLDAPMDLLDVLLDLELTWEDGRLAVRAGAQVVFQCSRLDHW